MAGRVELVVEGKLWAFRQRRVKDARVWLGEQQSGRVAGSIADDLASGRIGRIPRVADGPQCCTVEDSAIVEMQQEYRRLGGHCIELIDGR